MGGGNVKAAYDAWGHLPDRAFRVLAFMAVKSLDGDDQPAYWGGWPALALALGRPAPMTKADEQAVKRAVTYLRKAGAISPLQSSSRTDNAMYGLNLIPATGVTHRPVNNSNRGHSVTPVETKQGSLSDLNRGHSVTSTGVTHRPPHEYQEEKEQQQPRETVASEGGTAASPAADQVAAAVAESPGQPGDHAEVVAMLLAVHGRELDEQTAIDCVANLSKNPAVKNVGGYARSLSLANVQARAVGNTGRADSGPGPSSGPGRRRCDNGALVATDGSCCGEAHQESTA